jgi:predicted lactoylglutathione lyase
MSTQIFVNLPVKDLKRSMDFFTSLGYHFNKQFTDERAACLVINDQIYFMLLLEKFFNTFTPKKIIDTRTEVEVINALMVNSRKEVDELVDKAFKAGAKKSRDPEDLGFMYSRSFEDLDGHMWEYGYMDPSHVQST